MVFIGKVEIQGDVSLSPMAGVSDSPYRQICRQNGAAFSFSEFVSTDHIIVNNERSWNMFRFQEIERPIYFQIFGSKVSTVVTAAKMIEPLRPDVIDLNMGCSVSRVSHRGSGAGLLRNLPLVAKMVEGLCKSVSVPITAKIRIGWDSQTKNYKETLNVLQGSGIAAVTVHGRTKEMGYSGSADWNVIGEIKSIAKVPIFGNGDVLNYHDAMKKKELYGVDLVLIGRNAIGNPWVFQNLGKEPTVYEWMRTVTDHLENMCSFYPPDSYALTLFRKHLVRYIHNIPLETPIETETKTQLLQCIDKLELIHMLEDKILGKKIEIGV